MRQANPDHVITHARRAVALEPTNVDALLLLARALGVRGNLAEGRGVVTRALTLDPSDVEAVALMATFRKVMSAGNRRRLRRGGRCHGCDGDIARASRPLHIVVAHQPSLRFLHAAAEIVHSWPSRG